MTKQSGFSITEMMIVILLSSLVSAVIFTNYSFINRSTAKWKKNLNLEQEFIVLNKRVDKKIDLIRELDSFSDGVIFYKDKNNLACRFSAGRNGFKTIDSTIDWNKLKVDTGVIKLYSSDYSLDRNLDGITDCNDLDINHNGVLDTKEINAVDFVTIQTEFLIMDSATVKIDISKRLIGLNRRL
ncbi:MAG: type II secretion system protein [Fibrobacteres bacterium]|nr:type II secretion system protein [Fibrobacterota bacterium]